MSQGARRIVLLTGNSLCHNPRALKEAGTLARAGYDVTVLGAWLDPELKQRDLKLLETLPFRFVPAVDFARPGRRAALARWHHRAVRRGAGLAFDIAGLQSPRQLGYAIGGMFRLARHLDAALYIAHSEPGLAVACRLQRLGHRIAVDMEDWFSEDLLPEARRHRPLRLLRSLEKGLLREAAYASCPSQAMSAALAAEYGCVPPAIIYNAFPWSDRDALEATLSDRRNRQLPSVYWFSTTLGPGRGLEDLLAALPLLTHPCEVHLRGNPLPGMAERLMARLPEAWRRRLHLHSVTSNDRLLPRIAEHDIGFAGELPYCLNHDLTISNKILHYLLGGLAVVASDTAGQREIAARASGVVRLYPPGDPAALARALDGFLAAMPVLRQAQAAALAAARREFCWECQEPVLLGAVANALDPAFRPASAGPLPSPVAA